MISAVSYIVTLTCIAAACTTLRTVVAVAMLPVVRVCTAHCLGCCCMVNGILSAVVVVASQPTQHLQTPPCDCCTPRGGVCKCTIQPGFLVVQTRVSHAYHPSCLTVQTPFISLGHYSKGRSLLLSYDTCQWEQKRWKQNGITCVLLHSCVRVFACGF